jgi:hypothetical protein
LKIHPVWGVELRSPGTVREAEAQDDQTEARRYSRAVQRSIRKQYVSILWGDTRKMRSESGDVVADSAAISGELPSVERYCVRGIYRLEYCDTPASVKLPDGRRG